MTEPTKPTGLEGGPAPKKEVEVPFDNKNQEPTNAQVPQVTQEQFTELRNDLNAQTALGKLMADPDVRTVLHAKNSGQKVNVSVGESEPTAPVVLPLPDFDEEEFNELSQSDAAKKLLGMVGQVTAPAFGQIVDQKLAPILQGLERVGNYIQGQQASSVRKEIDKCHTDYADFSLYEAAIVNLAKASGGEMSVEECYLIARRRAGGGASAPPVTATERPTSSASGNVLETESLERNREPMGRGFGGFKKTLEDVMSNSTKINALLANLPE